VRDGVTPAGDPHDLTVIEQTLRVDAVTARVSSALSDAGIACILLKGRAFARELYDSPAERPFGDADLLVRPGDLRSAEGVLGGQLGYRRATPGEEESDPAWQRHAHNWVPATGGGVPVELHWTVVGVGSPDGDLWPALEPYVRPLRVGAAQVPALTGPATGWLASLHAAQHGAGEARPLRDLERALHVFSEAEWQAAARLAQRLESTGPFAAGLRLTPAGARMAGVLGLPDEAPVMVRLMTSNAPAGSQVLETLARAGGLRGAMAVLRRSLVPRPTRMRGLDPLARKGRIGLVGAYLRRPVLVARGLAPAWRAWRRARSRAARRHRRR
jgi:hypothetical protein